MISLQLSLNTDVSLNAIVKSDDILLILPVSVSVSVSLSVSVSVSVSVSERDMSVKKEERVG
jgi:hypothetical protein